MVDSCINVWCHFCPSLAEIEERYSSLQLTTASEAQSLGWTECEDGWICPRCIDRLIDLEGPLPKPKDEVLPSGLLPPIRAKLTLG